MTIQFQQHHPIEHFAVVDDCLIIGGKSLVELVAEAGQTPVYVYDKKLIAERVELLRQALPSQIKLHYAVKANPMPEVVAQLGTLVDGLDVASGGELSVARNTGADPSVISFAGPGKTHDELRQSIAEGITINLESAHEMEVAAALARDLGRPVHVAVRVNPDFELKTSGMKMGGGPKQFGVDAEQVPDMLRRIGELELDFSGFHIFSGSQNLRYEAICEAQTKTVALAEELADHAPGPVRTLNIGGGFGIPYFPGDQPLDLTPIGDNLSGLVDRVAGSLGAELILELGRYLVGEAGIYVCRVIDRKVSRGQVFLITDGGLHHHLAASGNFGQVIRKNYPVVVGNRIVGERREIASVVGPLCTPLDLLADRMDLAEAEIGDLIVVFQSGAYGLTASPTAFLSHPEPAEVLV